MKTRNSFIGLDLSKIKYDPFTGEFTRWNIHLKKVNKINPKPTLKGYLRSRIDGQLVMLHALAYFMMTGEDPIEIDHINRIKSDNRWLNLRNCTRNTNCSNRSISTGGASFKSGGKRIKRWSSVIKAFGKTNLIGLFLTSEEARKAYSIALKFVESKDEDGLKEFLKITKKQNKELSRKHYSISNKLSWEKRG